MWNSAQVVPNEPKTLGERLKKRRLELHLFQKDVAKLLGTHTATIQNWERGVYEPTGRFVARIRQFIDGLPRGNPSKQRQNDTSEGEPNRPPAKGREQSCCPRAKVQMA